MRALLGLFLLAFTVEAFTEWNFGVSLIMSVAIVAVLAFATAAGYHVHSKDPHV